MLQGLILVIIIGLIIFWNLKAGKKRKCSGCDACPLDCAARDHNLKSAKGENNHEPTCQNS